MLHKIVLHACVTFAILCHVACAAGKGRVRPDPVTPSTVLDGDATGLVEGCGNQPIVGFTYCRVQEGDNSSQVVWFIGPPSECDQKDSCVFFKAWDNQGQLVWGGSIPKGRTRVAVSWKTLLSSPTFELGHRGFWTWNIQVFWKDPDGKERISTAQGDIVLRVYRNGYLPLHEVLDDPSYVWTWNDHNYLYRMTSGLRAFIRKLR